MKAPVGLLSDRTVLRSKMEGPRPRQVHVDMARFLWWSINNYDSWQGAQDTKVHPMQFSMHPMNFFR